jgi:alcohol dehydrogenase class IV
MTRGGIEMNFEFATAGRILFGPGMIRQTAPLAAGFGRRPLLVTGGTPARAGSLRETLEAEGLEVQVFSIPGEPTVDLIRAALAAAEDAGTDLVIGFGGGSALDGAKAVAALLANGGDPLDYLEVIGRGRPLARRSVPVIAIPTTAGTGSEVTRNAVLASPEHGVKVSLRSPLMLPQVALVDPELTHGLPPAITASTGLDALTQLIEPFLCNWPNPVVDALCREGIPLSARSLRRACRPPEDPAARIDLALASMWGGLALANARLGAVHGLAAPLGGRFAAPHGAVCARLLPAALAVNLRALRERDSTSPVLSRFVELGRLLTGLPDTTDDDVIAWLGELVADLAIPPLRTHGLSPADFPGIVDRARVASSMQGNPVALTPDEIQEILERAF